MSVGSVGGGYNTSALFQRLARSTGNVSGNGGGDAKAAGLERPSGPPSGFGGAGFPGGEGGPKIPDGLKSKLDDVFSNIDSSTNPEDIKSKVTSAISEFKETDEYKGLSDDDKKTIDVLSKGPPKPDFSAGVDSTLSLLEQLGSGTRSKVNSSFGGNTTDSDLTKSLLSLIGSKE